MHDTTAGGGCMDEVDAAARREGEAGRSGMYGGVFGDCGMFFFWLCERKICGGRLMKIWVSG